MLKFLPAFEFVLNLILTNNSRIVYLSDHLNEEVLFKNKMNTLSNTETQSECKLTSPNS